jgi:hypothetical protein
MPGDARSSSYKDCLEFSFMKMHLSGISIQLFVVEFLEASREFYIKFRSLYVVPSISKKDGDTAENLSLSLRSCMGLTKDLKFNLLTLTLRLDTGKLND